MWPASPKIGDHGGGRRQSTAGWKCPYCILLCDEEFYDGLGEDGRLTLPCGQARYSDVVMSSRGQWRAYRTLRPCRPRLEGSRLCIQMGGERQGAVSCAGR